MVKNKSQRKQKYFELKKTENITSKFVGCSANRA